METAIAYYNKIIIYREKEESLESNQPRGFIFSQTVLSKVRYREYPRLEGAATEVQEINLSEMP